MYAQHVFHILLVGCCFVCASHCAGNDSVFMLFRHRSTAEGVAAALAHSFADATNSMHNNITDYVLGPMHGQPYPVASKPRPLPSDSCIPSDGCGPDDPGSEPEDPGTSQLLPLTDADSSVDSAASDTSDFGSFKVDVDSTSLQGASCQHPIAAPVERQQSLDDTPRARRSLERTTPPSSGSDRPFSHSGGVSAPPPHRQRGPCHTAANRQRSSALSTAQRRPINTLTKQYSQDDSSRSSFSFTLPLCWINPKRSRSADSAHETNCSAKKTHMTKSSAEDGSNVEAETQQPLKTTARGSFKQHRFLLQFCNAAVEKQFCLWQAQQRTKVCWHPCSSRVLPLWHGLLAASVFLNGLAKASLLWRL